MRNLSILLIVFLFAISNLTASAQNFESELTDESMEYFKKKVQFIYQLYAESIVTIIDEDVERVEKFKAKWLLTDLFETSNKKFTVRDYLADPNPKKMTIRQFANSLYEVENKLPIHFRKFKLGDSIKIHSLANGLSNKYSNLPAEHRKDKYFKSYRGELYFIEEFINSELGHNGYFDVKERSLLKRMAFIITHNENDQYDLVLESIDIIDPRNKTYDYKKLKQLVKRSSHSWSTDPNENYAEEIISQADRNGVKNLIELKDRPLPKKTRKYQSLYEFKNPSFIDFVIPGMGYRKFGPKHKSKINTAVYGTLFATTALPAIYLKVRGDAQLGKITVISSEQEIAALQKANRDDLKKSRILGVTAGVLVVVNAIHLSILNKKRKNIINKTKYRRFDLNFTHSPYDKSKVDGLAMSVGFTF